MEQINTGNWPFDGSITKDVQVEDLTLECLAFANACGISLNGTERVSGVMHYAWQASEKTSFEAIDSFIAYINTHKIPSFVLHDKRPSTPAEPEFLGRGLTRCATTEMLAQLEDDQMAFGLETLNKYLNEGVRPGVLSGTVATAYPCDIEERRAAFATESMQGFQVICDETNNPPSVVETGDLNVDILLNLNHISTKLSDMGISWQGGASQNINTEYAAGYAKHVLQLQEDHGVKPNPLVMIDGKLVASDTTEENTARVLDLFERASRIGVGTKTGRVSCAEQNESNVPKDSVVVYGYDVSSRHDSAVKTTIQKNADGTFKVLDIHTITALDVAMITDKQQRQMEHAETAEFLTEMRKESGRNEVISPAYVAALNAADTRKKQKKVKTKNRNKRSR